MGRPASVTIFGILSIVFGVLGVCGGAFGIVMMFLPSQFMDMPGMSNNPALSMMYGSGWWSIWLRSVGIFHIFLSIGLLASGIGLLMLRPWARVYSIVYAIIDTVLVLVNSVVNLFWLGPYMSQQMHNMMGQNPAAANIGMMFGLFSSVMGLVFGLAFPLLLLYFMTRPNVKQAFALAVWDGVGEPGQPG